MKILTLNTHSWLENNSDLKLRVLADTIYKEKFDIIALQEINQSINAKPICKDEDFMLGYLECYEDVIIKEDNFVLALVKKLREKGVNYFWSFVPSHIGYDIYDEGVAILSLKAVDKIDQFYISKTKDYKSYKTRRVVGLKVLDGKKASWFYSVHMGWWEDKEDPFYKQWDIIEEKMEKYSGDNIYLMGDFNSPSNTKGEGYSYILKKGRFRDSYNIAKFKDSGNTVEKEIDGWRNKGKTSMRIDYIFKNNATPVEFSKVIFNGDNYPIVSDHFGVYIFYND